MPKLHQALLGTLLIFSFVTHSEAGSKPDQVIQLFRHGARGPTIGLDPTWPKNEWSTLTPVGMRQQYVLGKVLAEKYSHLLEVEYNYRDVYAISDTTPRCIQSTAAQFYGIYLGQGPSLKKNYPSRLAVPPFEDARVQKLADSLPNVEAIPHNNIPNIVNIVGNTNAVIFQGGGATYCPNAKVWSQQNSNDVKAQEAFKTFQDVLAKTNSYLNETQKLNTIQDILYFGDVMLVDLADNRAVVGGIKDTNLLNDIKDMMSWFSLHVYYGQEVQRQMGAWNLVDAILKELKAFRENNNPHKISLFSGHDSNLNQILSTFGIVNDECLMANYLSRTQGKPIPYPNCYYPFFAANIIIEFYNETTTPYVKFFYNNVEINLCSTQQACSYQEFMNFAQSATGNNTAASYKAKCNQTSAAAAVEFAQMTEVKISNRKDLVNMGSVFMSFMCLLLLAYFIQNRRKYNKLFERSSVEGSYVQEYEQKLLN